MAAAAVGEPDLAGEDTCARELSAQWSAHPDGTTFPDYFQYDNVTKQPKGIIAIYLAGLP